MLDWTKPFNIIFAASTGALCLFLLISVIAVAAKGKRKCNVFDVFLRLIAFFTLLASASMLACAVLTAVDGSVYIKLYSPSQTSDVAAPVPTAARLMLDGKSLELPLPELFALLSTVIGSGLIGMLFMLSLAALLVDCFVANKKSPKSGKQKPAAPQKSVEQLKREAELARIKRIGETAVKKTGSVAASSADRAQTAAASQPAQPPEPECHAQSEVDWRQPLEQKPSTFVGIKDGNDDFDSFDFPENAHGDSPQTIEQAGAGETSDEYAERTEVIETSENAEAVETYSDEFTRHEENIEAESSSEYAYSTYGDGSEVGEIYDESGVVEQDEFAESVEGDAFGEETTETENVVEDVVEEEITEEENIVEEQTADAIDNYAESEIADVAQRNDDYGVVGTEKDGQDGAELDGFAEQDETAEVAEVAEYATESESVEHSADVYAGVHGEERVERDGASSARPTRTAESGYYGDIEPNRGIYIPRVRTIVRGENLGTGASRLKPGQKVVSPSPKPDGQRVAPVGREKKPARPTMRPIAKIDAKKPETRQTARSDVKPLKPISATKPSQQREIPAEKKLPVTRKYVILDRRNAVNMFGEYLKERDLSSGGKLKSSINTIIMN